MYFTIIQLYNLFVGRPTGHINEMSRFTDNKNYILSILFKRKKIALCQDNIGIESFLEVIKTNNNSYYYFDSIVKLVSHTIYTWNCTLTNTLLKEVEASTLKDATPNTTILNNTPQYHYCGFKLQCITIEEFLKFASNHTVKYTKNSLKILLNLLYTILEWYNLQCWINNIEMLDSLKIPINTLSHYISTTLSVDSSEKLQKVVDNGLVFNLILNIAQFMVNVNNSTINTPIIRLAQSLIDTFEIPSEELISFIQSKRMGDKLVHLNSSDTQFGLIGIKFESIKNTQNQLELLTELNNELISILKSNRSSLIYGLKVLNDIIQYFSNLYLLGNLNNTSYDSMIELLHKNIKDTINLYRESIRSNDYLVIPIINEIILYIIDNHAIFDFKINGFIINESNILIIGIKFLFKLAKVDMLWDELKSRSNCIPITYQLIKYLFGKYEIEKVTQYLLELINKSGNIISNQNIFIQQVKI